MLVCDTNGVSGAQGAGNDIHRVSGYFTDEIGDELDVEVGGVGSGTRLVRKSKAQEINGVDSEIAREHVKVFPPHEARRTSSDTVDKNQRRARVSGSGSLIKD